MSRPQRRTGVWLKVIVKWLRKRSKPSRPPEGRILVNKRGTRKVNSSGLKEPPGPRHTGAFEWIQYNLDRHARVAEGSCARLVGRTPRPISSPMPAVIRVLEFIDGKLVVHRGAAMPVRALANSTYADSGADFERAKSEGTVPYVDIFARSVRARRHAGGRR